MLGAPNRKLKVKYLSRIDAIRDSREERGGISISATCPTSWSRVCLKATANAHEVSVDRRRQSQSPHSDLKGTFIFLQISRSPPRRAKRSGSCHINHQQKGFPLCGESREAVE